MFAVQLRSGTKEGAHVMLIQAEGHRVWSLEHGLDVWIRYSDPFIWSPSVKLIDNEVWCYNSVARGMRTQLLDYIRGSHG